MVKPTEQAGLDSSQVKTKYTNRSQAIADLGLERYVMELEVDRRVEVGAFKVDHTIVVQLASLLHFERSLLQRRHRVL